MIHRGTIHFDPRLGRGSRRHRHLLLHLAFTLLPYLLPLFHLHPDPQPVTYCILLTRPPDDLRDEVAEDGHHVKGQERRDVGEVVFREHLQKNPMTFSSANRQRRHRQRIVIVSES